MSLQSVKGTATYSAITQVLLRELRNPQLRSLRAFFPTTIFTHQNRIMNIFKDAVARELFARFGQQGNTICQELGLSVPRAAEEGQTEKYVALCRMALTERYRSLLDRKLGGVQVERADIISPCINICRFRSIRSVIPVIPITPDPDQTSLSKA